MGSSAADPTSRLLRHERLIVASGVALLVALSWWFLATGAGMGGGGMGEGMAMAPPPLGAVVLMWWLMMFAMMLPSAAPTILLYGRVRHMRGSDAAIAQTWIFLAGYLAIWLLFAVAAAAGQQMLSGEAMMLADERLATGVLIAAGAILLASENAVKVANEAVQALGGAGYTKDWPVERYYRDAKLLDIGAGTNEVRRMLIGRELIGA
jgi:alkylation response protein AidB-like acyl-CoA dehydrogenase